MPAYVQIEGISRYISTRTTVRPDGAARDCVVDRSGGDPKLDALTCALILKRSRFQPAKWIDGTPAYAVLRKPVSWVIGGPLSKGELRKAQPADLDISLNRLPKGVREGASVDLMVAVDENGQVLSCDAAPRDKRDRSKTFPELVPVACREMVRQFRATPARDESGKPVRSVQTATSSFSTGPDSLALTESSIIECDAEAAYFWPIKLEEVAGPLSASIRLVKVNPDPRWLPAAGLLFVLPGTDQVAGVQLYIDSRTPDKLTIGLKQPRGDGAYGSTVEAFATAPVDATVRVTTTLENGVLTVRSGQFERSARLRGAKIVERIAMCTSGAFEFELENGLRLAPNSGGRRAARVPDQPSTQSRH